MVGGGKSRRWTTQRATRDEAWGEEEDAVTMSVLSHLLAKEIVVWSDL